MVDAAEESEILDINNDWEHSRNMEIWDEKMCLTILNGNQLLDDCDEAKKSRISKCILHCYYKDDYLMFKGLVVKQCRFRCASCFNKLDLVVVFAFKVDDHGHDEKLKDLDELPFWFFLLLVLSCMLYGVNVVIIFHERVPFNFGVPKKIWDSSRSRIWELGIERLGFHLSNS